ncbi:D-hexose-6-phosphate mutarotase [Pseudomonas matsuisoli]|uniref:Putative glucose-6-phosphate 1-epimerase n=1 Tax=Pseudomonas matsuisoli TaxID=1515666 RepID=A0A917PW31_9PSED|nr:D-hexose-6-phosphate mutarotase [Pseudomonas matsuisoli]GGJ94456.1 D-hexose-6-phosphate mutarotase [Pseudomonas matsuisoli]
MTRTAPLIEHVDHGQLPCLRVTLGDAELVVARQGAHVMSYRRGVSAAPLIWLSPEEDGVKGRPIRGGAPICWPWFGALARNPADVQATYTGAEPPQHGLVRGVEWQLDAIDETESAIELTFEAPSDLPNWPHLVNLQLRVRLDDALHLDLTTTNKGDTALPLSQALHTYFRIGDIHQAHIEGLDGTGYLNTLESWEQKLPQAGAVHFTAETDRVYLGVPDLLAIADPVLERRITLETRGSTSAVVWNPWIDKAARTPQFPDDGWQEMLCIETANVLEDRIVLAPGKAHTVGVTLRSTTLD